MSTHITITMSREDADEVWGILGCYSKSKKMAAVMNQIKKELTLPVIHYFKSQPGLHQRLMGCGLYLYIDDDTSENRISFDPRDVTCKKCKSTHRWQTAMGKKRS